MTSMRRSSRITINTQTIVAVTGTLRPANGQVADQKRTVTPREARDAGASVLVIGRPISRAEDPLAAVRAIEATL